MIRTQNIYLVYKTKWLIIQKNIIRRIIKSTGENHLKSKIEQLETKQEMKQRRLERLVRVIERK